MDWHYVKPLHTTNLIAEFAEHTGYDLPEAFRVCVAANNGGRPERRNFIAGGSPRLLKRFLSLNKDDRENAWSALKWADIAGTDRVPFAVDEFGNAVCFIKGDGSVVFIDHESGAQSVIARDFDAFLRSLF